MADTTFSLDELPTVVFTASFGSGGQPGLPSNTISIRGTMANPHYNPDYDYSGNVNGLNASNDPWKRHTETLVVTVMSFEGPNAPVPADPPPADPDPNPGQEPTDG